MNVMGELASIMGLTAIAGAIIGWCLKTFFPGKTVKKVRQHVARDIDDAVKDASHLRRNLDKKDQELRDTRKQLQGLLQKETTTDVPSNRAQVTEINDLKREIATVKNSLKNNQSEFNTYRTKSEAEKSELRKELNKFSAGGSANSERLTEANETVAALRSAVRENDKVIESLRARVKEGDTTVESLRGQLKTAESGRDDIRSVTLNYDTQVEELTKNLEQTKTTVDKQKREYDQMLERKNADIKNLHTKLEDLSSTGATLQTREHEFKKREEQLKASETKVKSEVSDLKRVIAERDAALSKSKQQVNKLNETMKTVEQRTQQELQRNQQEVQKLKTAVSSSSDSQSKIRSKSAEVTALNDMLRDSANKREALQSTVNTLSKDLAEKDNSIKVMRSELDDVVASRNKVSVQMGELQSQGNIALEKLQQDLNTLASTRDEYKSRIDSLQRQVSDLTQSKDSQLRELRTQLTEKSQSTEAELKQTNSELAAQTKTLQNDVKTLQAKLHDHNRTAQNQKTDLQKQVEINQRLTTQLNEKDGKLTEYRTKLVREESESQRLNRELSEAEALRLTLTQRDAELRTAQIALADTQSSGGPLQKVVEEQTHRNESLMSAMRERDEEISRLNAQVTNSSVRNKQLQSSINLLTQEQEAQAELVRSLEKQAETTLQLHTKIAQQSSEIEDLKARLYERDDSKRTSTPSPTSTRASSTLQQVETNSERAPVATGAKPRVFVRADTDTEALTGATNYAAAVQRPQFTKDGHQVRRADGSDELTLLPGVTQTIAGAFSRNGVTDFEQIALWTDREVAHYAERVGVSVQRAAQYNWPRAARNILNGTYSKNGQEIGNS